MTRPKAERRMNRELTDFVTAAQIEGLEKAPSRPAGAGRCHERYEGVRCRLWKDHPTLNHVSRRLIWRVESGEVTSVHRFKRYV